MHWIEQLFGVSPDLGSGTLETALLLGALSFCRLAGWAATIPGALRLTVAAASDTMWPPPRRSHA